MNNDTPETNEAQFGTGRVSVDFARRLERQRDNLERENAQLREALEVAERELVYLFTVLPISGTLPSPSVMQHIQWACLPNGPIRGADE